MCACVCGGVHFVHVSSDIAWNALFPLDFRIGVAVVGHWHLLEFIA